MVLNVVLKYRAGLPELCLGIIIKLPLFKLLMSIQLLARVVMILLVSVFIKLYA